MKVTGFFGLSVKLESIYYIFTILLGVLVSQKNFIQKSLEYCFVVLNNQGFDGVSLILTFEAKQ